MRAHQAPSCSALWNLEGLNANWASKLNTTPALVVSTFELALFEVSYYYGEAKGCYATLSMATHTLQEEYGGMVEDTAISSEPFKTLWLLINVWRWVERGMGRMTNLEFIFFHGPRTDLVESLYLMLVDPETQGPVQMLMIKCVTAH